MLLWICTKSKLRAILADKHDNVDFSLFGSIKTDMFNFEK